MAIGDGQNQVIPISITNKYFGQLFGVFLEAFQSMIVARQCLGELCLLEEFDCFQRLKN